MKVIKKVLFLSFLLTSFSASAEGGGIVFELGVHSGGDDVSRASTTSGEETVTAGGGISGAIGGRFDMTETFGMQLTFGFKEDAINATNGNIKFSRDTLDLLFQAKLGETLSLGVGPTLHTNVKLTADGAGIYYASDADFDNAVGVIADAKFDVGKPDAFFLALRLTFIEYTTSDTSYTKKTFSGNSVGLIWGGYFNLF